MFRLIKWMVIISIVVVVIYGAISYFQLSEQQRAEVKIGAMDALDKTVTTGPLAEKIRADFETKKPFEAIKNYIKKTADRVMGN